MSNDVHVTHVPPFGSIRWAQMWRILNPSGIEWPPLIVADADRQRTSEDF